MPRDAIQIGDVVQLKSGGPRMCVETEQPEDRLRCQWFAECQLQRGIFPAASLAVIQANGSDQTARRRAKQDG